MIINFLECASRLEKLDSLIRLENTGTPKELAENLNISERQLYRMLNLMKSMGAQVTYCKYRNTYKYTEPVKFKIGFIPE